MCARNIVDPARDVPIPRKVRLVARTLVFRYQSSTVMSCPGFFGSAVRFDRTDSMFGCDGIVVVAAPETYASIREDFPTPASPNTTSYGEATLSHRISCKTRRTLTIRPVATAAVRFFRFFFFFSSEAPASSLSPLSRRDVLRDSLRVSRLDGADESAPSEGARETASSRSSATRNALEQSALLRHYYLKQMRVPSLPPAPTTRLALSAANLAASRIAFRKT